VGLFDGDERAAEDAYSPTGRLNAMGGESGT